MIHLYLQSQYVPVKIIVEDLHFIFELSKIKILSRYIFTSPSPSINPLIFTDFNCPNIF